MYIYVSMMIWTAICGLVSKGSETTCLLEGKQEKRTNHLFAFLTMAYIMFFMSSISSYYDIPAYQGGFSITPSEPSEVKEYIQNINKYPGFGIFQVLFKTYISTEFQNFLAVIVIFDCLALCYVFRKYSCNFAFTVFLHIASGKITWMINGVKQFLAACIILAFSKFLMEKKFVPFAIGVIIASLFHTSALVVLPVYFFVHGKPWNKKMLLMMVCSVLAITFISTFTGILDFLLESTAYGSSYTDSLQSHSGSNILHFVVAAVPPVIALIGKKTVEEKAPNYIKICINMSIVTACVFFVASFTSGIFMGRMPIYFQMYSFIALPWLIDNVFDKESAKVIKVVCILCYLLMYYILFWEMPYHSKFLKLDIIP